MVGLIAIITIWSLQNLTSTCYGICDFIIIVGLPLLTSAELNRTLDEGSNLTLAVTIMYDTMEYLPLTDVSWVMPDGATTNSSINSTLPAYAGPVTSSFHLSSLSPDDAGVYAVTASNVAGSTTINFTITVLLGTFVHSL
jgi:hypothetical protein